MGQRRIIGERRFYVGRNGRRQRLDRGQQLLLGLIRHQRAWPELPISAEGRRSDGRLNAAGLEWRILRKFKQNLLISRQIEGSIGRRRMVARHYIRPTALLLAECK